METHNIFTYILIGPKAGSQMVIVSYDKKKKNNKKHKIHIKKTYKYARFVFLFYKAIKSKIAETSRNEYHQHIKLSTHILYFFSGCHQALANWTKSQDK